MFASTYEVNIDSKGRVSVPPAFRAALGGGERVFLWPALDGSGCLEGGGESLMGMYRQTIMRLPPQSRQRNILVHAIITRAHDLKMDEPGRIRLPQDWVEASGATTKVIFAGCVESFRIWEPSAYSAYDAAVASDLESGDYAEALSAPYTEALAAGGVPGLSILEGGES